MTALPQIEPRMKLKRVAVVQPLLIPGGGTEAVTAWTIEALKNDFDVSLITFSRVCADELNRFYGTELDDTQYSTVRPTLPFPLRRTRKFVNLKDHLMFRYCKSVRKRFDLFIGIGGTMDFGGKDMQYVALAPGSTLVKVLSRDPSLPIWYRVVKRFSARLFEFVSGSSAERARQNITMATSRWAGALVERLYRIPHCQVVYPPVNSPSANTDWCGRREGFLCVARISPEKKIEQAIEILERVRARGFDISLCIVGRQDDPGYSNMVKQLCQDRADWATLEGLMPKEELGRLMGQFKYGINAAADEPFGIALAELVKAGCIIFVPNSGGQTEIVGEDQLIFCDVDDGVNKICRVLEDRQLQETLRGALHERGASFSTQAFSTEMLRVVRQFFANQYARGYS